jgi:hypothetical protein
VNFDSFHLNLVKNQKRAIIGDMKKN